MYSENDLLNEVRAVREARLAAHQPVPKSWLVQAVLAQHTGIEGDDKDFYVCCAYAKVADTVRKVINQHKLNDDGAATEPTLDGFEHVQRSYLVDRDGEPVEVPTDLLTDAELLAKADMLDKFAFANRAHAVELRRYVGTRRVADAIGA